MIGKDDGKVKALTPKEQNEVFFCGDEIIVAVM